MSFFKVYSIKSEMKFSLKELVPIIVPAEVAASYFLYEKCFLLGKNNYLNIFNSNERREDS